MKSQKIFLVFIILLASFQICLGQEIAQGENWIGVIEGGTPNFLIHNFAGYTAEDVEKAKQKLHLIKQSENNDEWEGSYNLFGELSDTKLVLNSETGFVDYRIYTCAIELRALNYGKIISNLDSILLISEKSQPPYFQTDDLGRKELIKVKWGDRHYLIEETELEDFCEMAAGLCEFKTRKGMSEGKTFEYQAFIWNSFWVAGGLDKKAFGLPILPEAYKKYLKQPIQAKIIAIGKITKELETEYGSPSTTHCLTIAGGKDQGLKEDMSLYIPELQERVTVEKVGKKSSAAYLTRDYDTETQTENCLENNQKIPCVKPVVGMKAETISDEVLN